MQVAVCLVSLHIPASHSLKDKRQVLRSVLERTRAKFGVAIAEVGDNEAWQAAQIGISYVSNDGGQALEALRAAVTYIEESRPDLDLVAAPMTTYSYEG